MKYLKVILAVIVASGAIFRLSHLSNAAWIKLAAGVAFIAYLILLGIEAWKKKKERT